MINMTDVADAPNEAHDESPFLGPWAWSLSRYAGLLGEAVPAIRFERAEISLDGVEVNSLKAISAIKELWRTRFPRAEMTTVASSGLATETYPLLAFDETDGALYLLRDRAGSERILADTKDAGSRELAFSFFDQPSVHVFKLGLTDELVAGDSNKFSATEWFRVAIASHRSVFIEAALTTFLISTIGLASAMYTMQVYDRVVPTQGYSTLVVLGIGALIAIGMELLVKQMRAFMVDRACKAIDQDLSSVFFGKALDIRLDARPKLVGTFASQIRHFESVRNFMTSSTLFIVADAPFALFFIIVIAMIGGWVAIVPLLMLPITVLVGMAFRKPIERYTEEHMAESNFKNGMLIESIDGIESLKAASADWKMMGLWKNLTAKIAITELKMRSLQTMSTNLTQTMQQLSYAGMITLGAYLVTVGELTMGALIACSIIGGRALSPLAQIPSLIVQWKQAKIALNVLDNIMTLPGERDASIKQLVPDHCEGRLQLEDVSFSYVENMPSFATQQLTIAAGERVAILGPVGSGKSTLLKMLAGLVATQSGRVSIDSIDLQQLAPEFVREHVGYLPQDVRLFSGSLKENLLLGLPLVSDSTILAACNSTGLDKLIKSHPNGLDLPISEGGKGMSGGQRQLVGLTRLLLAKPSILLLDEPTASMDGFTEGWVMNHLFNEIPKANTIVVVTHKTAILPHVDRVIVVEGGKISIDGPRDKVMQAMKERAEAMAKQKQSASTK